MGMDVYGKKPTSEEGEYFRNSVWWWHPLATYIQLVAPKIVRHCTCWHSNDGDGLNAKQSLELADILDKELAKGATAKYAEGYKRGLDTLPRDACTHCRSTGVRRDKVGKDMGQHLKVIDEEGHPRYGQTGWCNACNGVGTTPPFETMYPFEVENVQAFARFLRACGGFRIC